jgi:hypothetical protein
MSARVGQRILVVQGHLAHVVILASRQYKASVPATKERNIM